jgi:aldose 1-epimerase
LYFYTQVKEHLKLIITSQHEQPEKYHLAAWPGIDLLAGCQSGQTSNLTQSGLNPAAFDSTINGKKTELITLTNGKGMEVCLTNYGGRVVSISVPDKGGKPTDVVCAYDNLRQYADTSTLPSD